MGESGQEAPGRWHRARWPGRGGARRSVRLLADHGIDPTSLEPLLDRLSGEGKTPMLVAIDGAPAGVVAVADTLKPGSAAAALQSARIDVIMMTGDNRRTAEAITAAPMAASSLSVVGNASRLRHFHPPIVDRPAPADTEDRPLVGTRS